MIHVANFERFQLKPKSFFNYDWCLAVIRALGLWRASHISWNAIDRSIIENGFWSNPFALIRNTLVVYLETVWENIANDRDVIEITANYLLISSLIQ